MALQPGDVVVISNDEQRADIMNVHGEVVGSFTNPQLYDDQGKEINARFFLVDDILALTERGTGYRETCTKATVVKRTYRIGALGVCGASGAGTGGLGGAACGAGSMALEDSINFESVC